MRKPVARWSTLAFVVVTGALSGCASVAPAGVFDLGRGAAALPTNTVRAQLGGGASENLGVVALGGGARLETQLSPDVAVGVSLDSGLLATTLHTDQSRSVVPVGGALTAQVNPGRSDIYAVRVQVGGGVDLQSAQVPTTSTGTAPWFALAGSLVLSPPSSMGFGHMEPYLTVNAGLRRHFSEGLSAAATPTLADALFLPLVLNAGVGLGSAFHFSEHLSCALSADVSGLLLSSPTPGGTLVPALGADVQGSLAWTF
jgi:hypothetical protein